jgi:hypothetical protein
MARRMSDRNQNAQDGHRPFLGLCHVLVRDLSRRHLSQSIFQEVVIDAGVVRGRNPRMDGDGHSYFEQVKRRDGSANGLVNESVLSRSNLLDMSCVDMPVLNGEVLLLELAVWKTGEFAGKSSNVQER